MFSRRGAAQTGHAKGRRAVKLVMSKDRRDTSKDFFVGHAKRYFTVTPKDIFLMKPNRLGDFAQAKYDAKRKGNPAARFM